MLRTDGEFMRSTISKCCWTHDSITEVYCAQLQRWTTRSARRAQISTKSARCLITRFLTSRRRLPRKFWNTNKKPHHTHRTTRACPRATPTSSDHSSITQKRSAAMIMTTSEMTSKLSSFWICWSSAPNIPWSRRKWQRLWIWWRSFRRMIKYC